MHWPDVLDLQARERPHKTFLIYEDRSWSYLQMRCWAEQVGNALLTLGVRPGERVATLMRNVPWQEAVLFGATRAGLVPASLSWRSKPGMLKQIFGITEPALVIAEPLFADLLQPLVEEGRIAEDRVLFVDAQGTGLRSFDGLVDGAPGRLGTSPRRADDLLMLAFTSGSTGISKVVEVTSRMLAAGAFNWIQRYDLTSREVVLQAVPFYHLGGLTACVNPALFTGGTHVLMREWDPEKALDCFARYGVTVQVWPETFLRGIFELPRSREVDWSSLRVQISGGEPVSGMIRRRFRELTGTRLVENYGMTETTTQVSGEFLDDPRETSGYPFTRSLEVQLVDPETFEPVAAGSEGHVLVRGDVVTPGYYRQPKVQAAAFREGWFLTGDVAREDEKGYLHVVGRIDDMFQSGGENIFPDEILKVLREHSEVADVYVDGVPDAQWGRTVRAVIARRPGSTLDASGVDAFCRRSAELEDFKRPRIVRFVDQIPRGPTGDVNKRELDEVLGEG